MSNHFIRYEHHGNMVMVDKELKGKHRDHCLCWKCRKFIPADRKLNCKKANELFKFCQKHKMTTPVFECPDFKPSVPDAIVQEL